MSLCLLSAMFLTRVSILCMSCSASGRYDCFRVHNSRSASARSDCLCDFDRAGAFSRNACSCCRN